MANKIRINDEYSYYRNKHCWVLQRTRPHTKGGTEHPTENTYHSTLEQLSAKVLDDCAQGCESVTAILDGVRKAKTEIIQAINNA